MLEILQAPPYCTIQDLGRPRARHAGVPVGGAMDPHALVLTNMLAGNLPEHAGLEWALGGGEFSTTRALRLAHSSDLLIGNTPIPPWTTAVVPPGTSVRLGPPYQERFGYLAIEGGIEVPQVLGSRSTYLPAHFGGFQGRLLRTGDRLPIGRPTIDSTGPLPGFELPAQLRSRSSDPIRFVSGPDSERLPPEAIRRFEDSEWTLSTTGDRMGYRLQGEPLPLAPSGFLPSAPVCPGVIQIPGDGQPIVLMPDGPTVGGYTTIGVVISVDLGRLAQTRPGSTIRFRRIEVEEAQALFRRQRIDWHTAHSLSKETAS